MMDVFVPAEQLPTLVDAPESPVTATAELVDAYNLSWSIDWDDLDRDGDGQPVFGGRRLIDALPLRDMELVHGDPRDPRDAAIALVAAACVNDCDRDYRAEDALTVTVAPSSTGAELSIAIDLPRLCQLAKASNTYDQAHAELLESLTGTGVVDLANLAARVDSDILYATGQALIELHTAS